jgi:hypothetical protein
MPGKDLWSLAIQYPLAAASLNAFFRWIVAAFWSTSYSMVTEGSDS